MVAPMVANVVAMVFTPILPLTAVCNATRQILRKLPVARPAWPTDVARLTGSANIARPITGLAWPTDISWTIAWLTRSADITGSLAWLTRASDIGPSSSLARSSGTRACWQSRCDISSTWPITTAWTIVKKSGRGATCKRAAGDGGTRIGRSS